MIFVSVGSMLPFDRLIRQMDEWAAAHPDVPCFAQIGAGSYTPSNMPWVRILKASEFVERVKQSSLLVSHAGTGNVLSAAEYGRPIVIVPRYADAQEHTTDHQVHTANWLRDRPGIVVAERGDDFDGKISAAMGLQVDAGQFSPHAPAAFLNRIRSVLTAE